MLRENNLPFWTCAKCPYECKPEHPMYSWCQHCLDYDDLMLWNSIFNFYTPGR